MSAFRYHLTHKYNSAHAASDEPDSVLRHMWPTNWRQRAIAAIELEESGRTVNGPYTIIDREHPNET